MNTKSTPSTASSVPAPKLSSGEIVSIFEDPLTETKLEGKAVCSIFLGFRDGLERWKVRFLTNEHTFETEDEFHERLIKVVPAPAEDVACVPATSVRYYASALMGTEGNYTVDIMRVTERDGNRTDGLYACLECTRLPFELQKEADRLVAILNAATPSPAEPVKVLGGESKYHAVRKVSWDQMWHALYMQGDRESWKRVSKEEADEISKNLCYQPLKFEGQETKKNESPATTAFSVGTKVQIINSFHDSPIATVKAVAGESVKVDPPLNGYQTWNVGDLRLAKPPLRVTLDPGRGPLIKRGHTLIARLPRTFGIDDSLRGVHRDDDNETWQMAQDMIEAYNSHAAHLAKIQALTEAGTALLARMEQGAMSNEQLSSFVPASRFVEEFRAALSLPSA